MRECAREEAAAVADADVGEYAADADAGGTAAAVFGREEESGSGLDPRGSGCSRRICVFRSQSS